MYCNNYTEMGDARRKLCALFPLPGKHLQVFYGVRATLDFLKNPLPCAESGPENPYSKGFWDGVFDMHFRAQSSVEGIYYFVTWNLLKNEEQAVRNQLEQKFVLRLEAGPKKALLKAETEELCNFVKEMKLNANAKKMEELLEVAHKFVCVKKYNVVAGNGFDEKMYIYARAKGRVAGQEMVVKYMQYMPITRVPYFLPQLDRNWFGGPAYVVTRPPTIDFVAPCRQPLKRTIKREIDDYDEYLSARTAVPAISNHTPLSNSGTVGSSMTVTPSAP